MDEKIVVGVITAILIVGGLLFDWVWSMIFYIGLIRFGIFIVSIGKSIKRNFLQKPLDLAERYGRGSWAFITGAANGLGLEYSLQLSKLGFNIIMVDKDEDGLIKGKERIQKSNENTEIVTVTSDLTKLSTVESVIEIINKVSDKDISILINNAGLVDNNEFLNESAQKLHDIVQVNVIALAMFTCVLFNKLESREKKSAIINMASVFSYTPNVIERVYTMTKAFVLYFSKSLHYESKGKVDILTVCPGFVSTQMTGFRKTFDTIQPTACISGVLKDLGQHSETNTHWLHELIFNFIQNTWYINSELTNKIYTKMLVSSKDNIDNSKKEILEKQKNE